MPPPPTPQYYKKRKRISLSCFDCRRRKLKCDREFPACGRCRRAGQAETCYYDDAPARPSPVNRFVTPVRLASVEATPNLGAWQLLGHASSATGVNEQLPLIRTDVRKELQSSGQMMPGEPETNIFRGKNFMTQYYGSSNPISLISHLPELRSFMKETIMQRTSLATLQRDLKALQVKWKASRTELLPKSEAELFCLLPDQETVDAHVGLYWKTFETVYHVLHYPSFSKEYDAFRQDHRAAKPAFVVLLLLIMASVSCIAHRDQWKYIGETSVDRERATLWVEAAEGWLSTQSQKNVYLAIWQIRCLLVVAKQVNSVKKKRVWTVAGNLVREAISAGFHRDPSLLGERVSLFDQEMRRRLWATIIELDLQASIDRGMPSAMACMTSDATPLRNVDDEDLVVDDMSIPACKPWTEFTKSSFLHVSAATFALRTALNCKVNDLGSRSTYEEVLDAEEKITAELKRLPNWNEVQGASLARSLLELQLRHFLMMLHAPFARQSDTNPRYSLSRMVCFNAAFTIIEKHHRLTKSGNHLLLLLRHDYFRAALVVCHNMYIAAHLQNNILLGSNSTTILQYIETSLDLISDRITRHGTGYTNYWYISAAYAFLQCVLYPTGQTARKEEAIDRIIRQYHRILASQEDLHKAKEILFPMRLDQIAPPGDGMLQTGHGGFMAQEENMAQDPFERPDLSLSEFYFGNPSAWIFDNMWEME
ncbi:hypothetical protein BO70DRAFT_388176 [Aspergillus heteromorphus CBS 117.55]|uniref:Zn(2)-C6 fungal-type domain-containing protein n=1 Tax=Aspergillus heteromorphus CBS 117.55 TaxID=1448321 RepID=A0A317VYG0_9EURO|nr:uncharacterized protein BO70DRAFT_388176 [Aspergillus heteromorphus CBS 117.55]PWY78371.1 hypothetical protein BO70DRAFT_388176 [Aspergillus heteromorphus CBS 117.55]